MFFFKLDPKKWTVHKRGGPPSSSSIVSNVEKLFSWELYLAILGSLMLEFDTLSNLKTNFWELQTNPLESSRQSNTAQSRLLPIYLSNKFWSQICCKFLLQGHLHELQVWIADFLINSIVVVIVDHKKLMERWLSNLWADFTFTVV